MKTTESIEALLKDVIDGAGQDMELAPTVSASKPSVT
jgi:hypothetical protein